MTYAARLVWNIDNWEYPSGQSKHGIYVTHHGVGYHYGLEEWLNNKRLRALQIGYLDCYRTSNRGKASVNILLFTVDPSNNHYYHVGIIRGVTQLLAPQDIQQVRMNLGDTWLPNTIDPDFRRIEHTTTGQLPQGKLAYENHNWNSTKIDSEPPGGFIVNIRYDKLDLFDRSKWVNLTMKDPDINNLWRRIRNRYKLPQPSFNQELKNYFEKALLS